MCQNAALRFEEVREDLALTLRADGSVERVHTRFAGGCLVDPSRPERMVHWTDGDSAPAEPWLETERPLTMLGRVIERIGTGPAPLEVDAHWVAFEQRVRAGEVQGPTHDDRRRGWRVRLDARSERRGRVARASVELARGKEPVGDDPRLAALVAELRERLDRRLDRVVQCPGPAEIVLAPGVGGVLIHELVGHALEADTVLARRSWLDGGGIPGIAPGLTVIDDPGQSRAPFRVDDEGQPARRVELVRSGRVVGALHDRTTAAAAGTTTTGHGRRSSHRNPVRPRMACTFIASGPMTAQDVLGSVRRGVYIRRMEAGSIDPATGRAVFRVTDADRILEGEIEAPVGEHVMIVDGRTALASLDRIADDLAFDTCVGACHRDGQALVMSVGAPTVCIGVNVLL